MCQYVRRMNFHSVFTRGAKPESRNCDVKEPKVNRKHEHIHETDTVCASCSFTSTPVCSERFPEPVFGCWTSLIYFFFYLAATC